MTEQLTISDFFEGKEVRVLSKDGNIWFPLVDLAEAWGTNRKTLDSITIRNDEVFKDYVVVWNVAYPNEKQIESKNLNNYLKYVNEQGLYMLMGKVIAGRLKDPEAKKRIIRFQKKVPELLRAIRAGEAIVVPTKQILISPKETIKELLDVADLIIERCNVPKEIAYSQALTLAGNQTKLELATTLAGYIKAQTTKQIRLPEAIPEDVVDYERHHSITKLAGFLKLPVDKVRNVLESLNVIYFENGIWHLTKYGEKFGKKFMVTPGYPYSSRQRAYIKYNPDCVELLKKYFEGEVKV